MRLKVQDHAGHSCDCSAHRAQPSSSNSGFWASLFPVLACALCPACLTTYAKLFSVFGVSFGLSELQHLILLVVAIAASLTVSGWRSWRMRRAWPVAVAAVGAGLVVTGHLAGELHFVEWAGVLVLLAGGLTEHFRLRSRSVPVPATSS
jgi:hypothetical protein